MYDLLEFQFKAIQCACFNYFTGTRCETEIPLCARDNACYNGGTCVNNLCKCKANFIGYQCETYSKINIKYLFSSSSIHIFMFE